MNDGNASIDPWAGQVWQRTDFRTAQEKYAAVVADSRHDSPLQTHLSNYSATYELSAIEAEIFGIEPDLTADLFWAHERYQNMIGVVDAYFEEHRVQERIDHARFLLGDCVYDIDSAVGFMVRVCHLPTTQCMGWVFKVLASQLRGGLMDRDA